MVWEVFDKLPASGIYNVGTGTARTFNELGAACFSALNIPMEIEYIDIPADLRDKYQYFTEAEMTKWKASGLTLPATSLEEGTADYIQGYLLPMRYL